MSFVVSFVDEEGDSHVLAAGEVTDSPLGFSFVKVSGFLFPSHSSIISPTTERLSHKLKGVKALHLSLSSISSIREMETDKPLELNDKRKLVLLPQR